MSQASMILGQVANRALTMVGARQVVRGRTRRASISVSVAAATGPLPSVKGRRILVLADVENLSYSARDLGFKVSYRALGDKLREASRSCFLHAFFSREAGDGRRVRYFLSRDWIPHPWDIQTVREGGGLRRLANSDNLILFFAGLLVAQGDAEVVVVASGDGDLVCDLARALALVSPTRRVVTLSLPGSTSRRLDARTNGYISGNIELGRDCLRLMSARRMLARY